MREVIIVCKHRETITMEISDRGDNTELKVISKCTQCDLAKVVFGLINAAEGTEIISINTGKIDSEEE